MTPQSSFMVAAPIREGHIEALKKLLATMNVLGRDGMADAKNQLIPFIEFGELHFARFVILDDQTLSDFELMGLPKPSYPIRLAFLGDYDGTADFLAVLIGHPVAAAGLKKIFAHCEDFHESSDLLAWIKARELRPAANYVNWVGRTVAQIREEAALRDVLVKYVDDHAGELQRLDPQKVHATLKDHARAMRLSPPARTSLGWQVKNLLHAAIVPGILILPWLLALPFLRPHSILFSLAVIPALVVSTAVFLWLVERTPALFALLVALGLMFLALLALFPRVAIVVALVVLAFIWILRRHEKNEPEIIPKPTLAHIHELTALEDHDVSNQYSLVGSVKPSLFRHWMLSVILWLIDYGARHIYNRGNLGRIQTIHFARWVFLDGKKRIFFGSNYDGSDEAYMDDFINKVGWGLTLAFAAGVGYPRTNWLIFDGAKEEQKFKATNRRHQIPTQVWYKAYPGQTGFDLARNARVRQGFERNNMTDQEIRTWMRDL